MSWLYAINLSTGDTQELGIIATPQGSRVSGIAVARGLASSYTEIPTLSHIGFATLSLLLASSALWQLRLKLS